MTTYRTGQRNAAAAAAVPAPATQVAPRLAALGPSLNLGALTTTAYRQDDNTTAYRFAQVVAATVVGMVILMAPMGAIAYAAEELNSIAKINDSTTNLVNNAPVNPATPAPPFQPAYTEQAR